jgi:membrane-associated phospholipid phosphatase
MDNRVLLALFLLVALLYFPLNRRKPLYYWKTRFDDKLPLIPVFVVPYILHTPFIAMSFWLLSTTPIFRNFLTAQLLCFCLGCLFWLIFPNGVKRPKLESKGGYKLLNFIYKHDGDTNGTPSGHVFTTSICIYFFHEYPIGEVVGSAIIIGIFIIISTIFTKQHYIVDVVGGVIFALFSILLVRFTSLG